MSLEISKTLNDYECKVLENDLLNIQDWVNGMVQGKIDNCKNRLASQERQRLISEGATTVPASIDALCQSAFDNPNYKNRTQREAELNQE